MRGSRKFFFYFLYIYKYISHIFCRWERGSVPIFESGHTIRPPACLCVVMFRIGFNGFELCSVFVAFSDYIHLFYAKKHFDCFDFMVEQQCHNEHSVMVGMPCIPLLI